METPYWCRASRKLRHRKIRPRKLRPGKLREEEKGTKIKICSKIACDRNELKSQPKINVMTSGSHETTKNATM